MRFGKMIEVTPEEQATLGLLQSFLAAFGPARKAATAEESGRRRRWVAEDPDTRLAFLGLTRERARELGYDV